MVYEQRGNLFNLPADQTPTPTRFLRQCEEVGLFQDISLNPFDEQFRRASLLRSHHSVTEVKFFLAVQKATDSLILLIKKVWTRVIVVTYIPTKMAYHTK